MEVKVGSVKEEKELGVLFAISNNVRWNSES